MSVDTYAAAFRQRARATRKSGQELVDEPGIVALIGTSPEALDGRALVMDDRAFDVLSARQPAMFARVISVFTGAEACHRLMSGTAGFRREPCTAMVRDDLTALPDPGLPDGLTLRPVSRSNSGPGTVSLEDAAAAAMRADPEAAPADSLADFVDYLRSVPHAQFLAAVDDDGEVQATAAAAIWGDVAGVFFVDTDPRWRGRGVGTAMTAAALHSAAAAGARSALLDSSALGLSIYRRLGFQAVSDASLFITSGR
jgi:GNAT superfamily N-acetyltransferase